MNSSPISQRDEGPINIVIMGCGRLGASIASALVEQGNIVKILDINVENFNRLPRTPIELNQLVPIIGDGTTFHSLRKADIEEADVFIAVSGRDTQNALASQVAGHVFDIPVVITRMNDPIRKNMYEGLGLIAISNVSLISDMIVNAAQR